MDTHRLSHLTAVPMLLAVLLALGACSSRGGDSAEDADAPAAAGGPAGEAEGGGTDAARRSMLTDSLSAGFGAAEQYDASATREADEAGSERSIISRGVVAVVGEDVAQARFDVQKIIDGHDGEVAEEKTETDEDGAVSRSRLVVRVPVSEFDATMEALEKVAQLESSSRSSEDVTTTVIDNEVRIRAQTESLKRIEVLLAQARTIRDIVNIESQLTRRQADLDSLKQQQAYLADQTSMSTITVFLEAESDGKKPDEDASGFLAGLGAGWDALKALTTGVTTVVGTALPFAALLLLVGAPTWLLLRRRVSRGRTGRTPSAA